MLVFVKERLVFLAMPKTGTTAWAQALGPRADMVVSDPPELKHAPLYRYDRFFRPIFETVCDAQMETLAVVREPVDWLGSWWRYRRRPFLAGHANSTAGVAFEDFVTAYLSPEPPAFARVGSQSGFLRRRPKGAEVTHLFRYERPERLAAFLSDRLGVTPELARINVSPEGDTALSPALEARLRRDRAAEFALWEGTA